MAEPDSTGSPRPATPSEISLPGYTFSRTLGQGNYGKVKLAVHQASGRKVAVKIVRKKNLRTRTDVTHMRREIKLLHLLRHPSIAQLYDVAYKADTIYLVMEYCQGGELFDYIIAHKRVSENRARSFFSQMVSAMHYCHSSFILHRDLKPQNILLDSNNQIKLVDFGFATNYSSERLVSTICGTPYYSSPEVCNSEKYNGPAADVWSMGVVLYVLLTGRLPYKADNVKALHHNIMTLPLVIPDFLSADCAQVIRRTLTPDPAKRITTAELMECAWLKKCPPVNHVPPREPPAQLSEEVLNKLREIGFSGTEIREAFKKNVPSALTCAYHLMNERMEADKVSPPLPDHPVEGSGTPAGGAGGDDAVSPFTPESMPVISPSSARPPSAEPKASGGGAVRIPKLRIGELKAVQESDSKEHQRAQSARPRPTMPSPNTTRTRRTSALGPENHSQLHDHAARMGAATERGRGKNSMDAGAPLTDAQTGGRWFAPLRRTRRTESGASRKDGGDSGGGASTSPRSPREGGDARLSEEAGGKQPATRKGGVSGALSRISVSARSLFSPREQPRVVRGSAAFNVSTTSSKMVPEICAEVERVLHTSGLVVNFERNGYCFLCVGENGLEFELEVVRLKDLKIHALRSRRMAGDSWIYKQTLHELFHDFKL